MRDATELTEHEAELVNRAIGAYPGALAYLAENDPPVLEVAGALIDDGRLERTELVEHGIAMVAYRLTEDYAVEIGEIVEDRARSAELN